MTTTQLIYSDVSKAIKTLITNEALDAKHSKLEREYLKGNISPTTLDYKEAAQAALIYVDSFIEFLKYREKVAKFER